MAISDMLSKKNLNENNVFTVGNIPFDENIDVATNELFLRATINRNTEKLLSNDLYLWDFVLKFKDSGDYTVLPWKPNNSYRVGDVVIYTEYNVDKDQILNVYILRCIENGNSTEPKKKTTDGYIADFNESGWENLNPFFSLFYSDDTTVNLDNYLSTVLSNRFEISHELDLEWHKFGNLSANAISSVVLKTDVSNIGDERNCGYWPYEVKAISSSSYVGTMKKWGMGVVEYDLTCSLRGSQSVTKIDASGNIETKSYLAANTFIPMSSDLNDDYFLDRFDYTIFAKDGSSDIVDVGGMLQTNLLSTMNVFHGKIEFPIPFANLDYMVFANAVGNGSEIGSPNVLTFVDRTFKSIEMLYAIPNYNGLPIEKVALKQNEFQCQIVGKWR